MSQVRASRMNLELGFVACMVGTTTYALNIESVQEIILPAALTEIPQAPHGIIGAVDHRGEVVPVLDLGLRFGNGVTDGTRRKWILVRTQDRTLGVVVDQVHEVFRTMESEIRPAPEVGDLGARSAHEVVAHGDRLAFILDTQVLAKLAQMSAGEGTIG